MKHDPDAPSWFIVEPDDDFLWFNPKDCQDESEEPFETLDAKFTVYWKKKN